MPLAISSAVRSSLSGVDWSLFSVQFSPLFEFRLPPEFPPAVPSRPDASDQHLSWASAPYSTRQDRRSTCRRLCPPATFRPQGLVTLSAAYSLRSLAGFVSHRRRSWDSPFGAVLPRKVPGMFPHRESPRTVCPADIPRAIARGRPGRPRFLGFDPRESLRRPTWV